MSAAISTNNIGPAAHIVGDTKEQIKSLLSGGCTQRQAALAVGVDESYVSQLMTGDERFANDVISARIVALKDQSARDGQYDLLEDKILKKLNDQLSMIVNPDRLVRMLSVVNGAKRRGAQQQDNGQNIAVTNVINLSLPAAIVNRYRTNTSNEVIEVNEQGMVGMPASALMEKIRPGSTAIAQMQAPLKELTTSGFEIMKDEGDGGGEAYHESLKRKRQEAAERRQEALAARVKAATIDATGNEY